MISTASAAVCEAPAPIHKISLAASSSLAMVPAWLSLKQICSYSQSHRNLDRSLAR